MDNQKLLEVVVQLLVTALPLITTLLSYLAWRVAQWVKAQRNLIVAKTGAQNFSLLEQYLTLLVKTAEQFGLKGIIEDVGSTKKEWVLARAQEWLDERKVNVSARDLEVVLEAALRDGVHKSWDVAEFNLDKLKADVAETNDV